MRADFILNKHEQEFATSQHHLIEQYLRMKGLPIDEWYDIVVFRYLRSVYRWFHEPELRKYSFRSVCFLAMRSAIGNELEKQKRQVKTISLDSPVPGTENLIYHDIITKKNLELIGVEQMNISYNVKVPERKFFRGGMKSDETIANEGFLVSKMKNMCFEYETVDEAKKKVASIQTYRRKHEHKEIYDAFRNENKIYIVRNSTRKSKK